MPAKGFDVLFLFADGLFKNINLDMTSLLRQLIRMDQIFLIGMQSFQKGRCEAAGRSESSTGRNVRHARDFQISRADVHEPKSFTNNRMTNLIDGRSFFQLGILEKETIDESRVNKDIHIFVDRSSD